MIKEHLNISNTLFATFRLNYQSPMIADNKICDLEFSDTTMLYAYLQAWIKNDLAKVIDAYLIKRTQRFQVWPDKPEALRAIRLLRAAPQLVSGLPLLQTADIHLKQLIPAMIDLLPEPKHSQYYKAFNQVERLEQYCTDIVDFHPILLCDPSTPLEQKILPTPL